MNQGFVQIGSAHGGIGGENSFWPSFTDIMMVITLIFLMATSILVVRNWQLVAELQESITAERLAAQLIESTSMENATLEERLASAEQSNSILRLRLLKKNEELAAAQTSLREQESSAAKLQQQNLLLQEELAQARKNLEAAGTEIETATVRIDEMSDRVTGLEQQLALQQQTGQATLAELEAARIEIADLASTSTRQQQTISELSDEKAQLVREISDYNQQLLVLKGEYETVSAKYEELIKPARSPKGKYIASVYYVKGENGNVIRYSEPGDDGFSRLSLAEVERRLDKLKQEKGADLYVKIIIPEDSGLAYNEAWEFMRKLLVKYDYYYQE